MRAQKVAIILICLFILTCLIMIFGQALDLLGYEGQLVNRYINVSQSDTVEIKGDFIIGQTFVAPVDGLQRIDVVLRTFGRQNTKDVNFILTEIDASEFIYRETFNASEAGNNQWRTFEFPPITNSQGKTFLFYFGSPESIIDDAITVGGGEGDFYSEGSAIAGPMPTNADLAFRTYYGLSAAEKMSIFGRRLVEDKPAIWGNLFFYVVLVIFYGLILLWAFIEIFKLVWPNREEILPTNNPTREPIKDE